MDRRKFLLGVGGASIGGSALLGSGAFSRVESQRSVEIAVARDPDAYLGLKPLDTPNSQNYVALDEKGHLKIQIDGDGDLRDITGNDGPIGEGVNSDSRTWFDGMFEICNQGKEDACISWEFGDDFEMRDEAELVFYYDGDEDGDLTTEGRVDVEEGREVPLGLGECATIGLRTETFDVDATDDDPLFDGEIKLIADVDGDCFEKEDGCLEPDETTWAIDPDPEDDGAGGPVTLLGIDTEDGGIGGHGPVGVYVGLVEDILDNVTNDEEGVLVIGTDSDDEVKEFWDEIDSQIGQDVSYVAGASNIEDAEFDQYAMLAVVTSEFNEAIGSGQDLLTNAENDALVGRASDVAEFVNDGGGLMASSQTDLDQEWGFVGGLNTFETVTGLSYSSIWPTEAGEDVGLGDSETGESDLDVCCWHDVYPEFPDFLNILAYEEDEDGRPAALGGEATVIPVAVDIAVTGPANVGVGETASYDVAVTNIGEEPEEDVEFEVDATSSGSAVMTNLPTDPFTLEEDYDDSWDDAIEVTCDTEGSLNVQVRLVGADTGDTVAELDVSVECIPDPPGIC